MNKGSKTSVIADDKDETVYLGKKPLGGRDDDDDDDHNERQHEYEDDGFIVDDVEEDSGVDDEEKKRKKRKKRRKKHNMSRQQPGSSSAALQEANSIFGDVDQFLNAQKTEEMDKQWENGERGIDQFHPGILSEKYTTKRDDDEMQGIDIPERMQICNESTGHSPTDMASIDIEREWIYNQITTGIVPLLTMSGATSEEVSKFKDQLSRLLILIHADKLNRVELEDAKEAPEEMVSSYTSMALETSQAVVKGARHMICSIFITPFFQVVFMDNAVVLTSPTAAGKVAIDSFHQFAGVKCLRDKLITKFEDGQFLLIQKAEEEKLLQVVIKLSETVLDKLNSDCKEYYLSDGVSNFSQLWNEQMKLILYDAINNILLPSMEKETRSLLISRAKTWLLCQYGKLMRDKVSVAPYRLRENNNSAEETRPKVTAACWDPGKPATTFVMLDSSGEGLDALHADSLSLHGQSISDQQWVKSGKHPMNNDDDVLEIAVEHVREKPKSSRELDVFEYAQQKNHLNKTETLRDIRLKLIEGFHDWRKSFEEPSQDDEFCMISGRTKEALSEGRLVQATILRVQEECAFCVLESGMSAVLYKEDYRGDGKEVDELTDKLHVGDLLTCRIKSIQKSRDQVISNCRGNEVRRSRFQNMQNMDPYYHEECKILNTEWKKDYKLKELAKKLFKPRMIKHPWFKNFTTDEAVEGCLAYNRRRRQYH